MNLGLVLKYEVFFNTFCNLKSLKLTFFNVNQNHYEDFCNHVQISKSCNNILSETLLSLTYCILLGN